MSKDCHKCNGRGYWFECEAGHQFTTKRNRKAVERVYFGESSLLPPKVSKPGRRVPKRPALGALEGGGFFDAYKDK